MKHLLPLAAAFLLSACAAPSLAPPAMPAAEELSYEQLQQRTDLQVATLAGGCFWCMEGPFEAEDGVVEAIAGFAGGTTPATPTYEQVTGGLTDYREAVQIFFDPAKIEYQQLLDIYWRQIDPTDGGGQFADRGHHYTTAIYTHSSSQQATAEASRSVIGDKFEEPIATEVLSFTTFTAAGEEHQDFYKDSAARYKRYKQGSGRADFIKTSPAREFQKPDEAQLRAQLSEVQYHVTQEEGTERPFDNPYWDNKQAGIYVDIVSGEPLFSSLDKYKSGTGWPSFVKPIEGAELVEREDRRLFSTRTEIRSKLADSHVGHVFPDGPSDRGGLRYCMNSAAMRFVPVSELSTGDYEQYLEMFQ